jgi:hypothetical protein
VTAVGRLLKDGGEGAEQLRPSGVRLHHDDVSPGSTDVIRVSLAGRLGEDGGWWALVRFSSEVKVERAVQHDCDAGSLMDVTLQNLIGREPGLNNGEPIELE